MNSSLVGEVKYEPFLVMLASHDGGWSSQDAARLGNWTDPLLKPARELSSNCEFYKNHLNENHSNFLKAAGNSNGNNSEVLSDFLFDPICYLPLGHAHIFSITLLDDFDPAEYLTTQMRTTLEKVHLGFVPKMNAALGITHYDQNFCNLKEIWDLKKQSNPAGLPPLLVFTKFKLDGLAGVGLGISSQIALWRTMVVRVREIVKALKEKFPGRRSSNANAPICLDEIEKLKCCFLDLQGCEEIGVLFFCENLSVAFSLIRGFRTLTFENVFRCNPDFAPFVSRSRLHTLLVANAKTKNVNRLEDIDFGPVGNALCDNHIFRWTDSSVSVLAETCPGKWDGNLFSNVDRIQGLVSATSRFQVLPGHCRIDRTLTSLKLEATPHEPQRWDTLYGFAPFTVGVYDTVLHNTEERLAKGQLPLLRFRTTIHILDSALQTLCKEPFLERRDVVNFETELIVPVPDLIDGNNLPLTHGEVGPRNSAFLVSTLSQLVQRLCYPADCPTDHTELRQKGGALNITELMDGQRQLGVPAAMRRTITYLYQNFAVVLADPLAFDAVLDLYDSLATLHNVLTHIELSIFPKGLPNRRPILDEGRVNCLAEITEALHNAMLHHTAHAFRDITWRDMAVDFRGGLNQILYAADVPLKCGLGVLRRFTPESPKLSRNTVGCMMRITSRPGVRCCKLNLGIEEHARLSFLDVDVPHIFHVASYGDYLHEAFHLVFEESVAVDPVFKFVFAKSLDQDVIFKDCAKGRKFVLEQTEEIFAQMLWRLFLFGDDNDAFLYHCVLTFSLDTASTGPDNKSTCKRFSEVMLRLFLASDCSRNAKGDPRFWNENHSCEEGIRERFEDFVKKGGPFFSEFKRMWEGDPERRAWEYTMNYFDQTYARIKDCLPIVWGHALNIYRKTVNETFPGSDQQEISIREMEIRAQIRDAFETGSPLIWHRYSGPGQPLKSTDTPASCNLVGNGMDALTFICFILRQYIDVVKEGDKKEVHLRFNPGNRQPIYEGINNWWELQADKGVAALFCPVPAVRAKRFLKQISTIKSFWDVASELRARRLLEMLTDNGLGMRDT